MLTSIKTVVFSFGLGLRIWWRDPIQLDEPGKDALENGSNHL